MEHFASRKSAARRTAGALLVLSLLALGSGCAAIGAIANAMPRRQPAAYPGLAGQSVGVMVWADRGARIDWPSLQLDLASRVQDRLRKTDARELKDTTWPVLPASIARYQKDHPGIEAMPITDVAPKLGVARLIYIEVEAFSTRSEASFQMYRGNATATLKLVEVSNGQGKVAYEESGIRVAFPPRSPVEGILNATDVVIYHGTLAALSEQIANRFITHEAE